MENQETQITKQERPKTLKGLISSDSVKSQMALAMPKHLNPDMMARVAVTALNKNPKLQQCSQASFMSCMLDLSAIGLVPDGRLAHLIPYKDVCTLVIDYKGLVELVMRSGNFSKIYADIVRENDDFSFNKGEVERHHYSLGQDRGKVIGTYAIVTSKDGVEQAEVMSMDEIEKIMKSSNGYKQAKKYNKSSIWDDHFEEMAKKTVFRRLTKWLKLSPEIQDGINKIDEHEFRNVTPEKTSITDFILED